ncbi:MAG TPA: hypothetical protein VFY98_14215 [Intrasporangium sp.]|nr:hypothetical protein [Intrasporangium sp.]
MTDPSVVVQRATEGWTHIGGPGVHLLIGLEEDDDRTLTATDPVCRWARSQPT